MRIKLKMDDMKRLLFYLWIIGVAALTVALKEFDASSGSKSAEPSAEVSLETASFDSVLEYVELATVATEYFKYPNVSIEPPTVDVQIEEDTEPATESYLSVTDEEIYALACLIWLEGRGESIECQEAIASVVVNRYTSGLKNYSSIIDVIYEPEQFSPAPLIKDTRPDQIQLDVATKIVTQGPTIPEYVTYFRSNYYHDWGDLIAYTYIDHTYFSYSELLRQAKECAYVDNSTGE